MEEKIEQEESNVLLVTVELTPGNIYITYLKYIGSPF